MILDELENDRKGSLLYQECDAEAILFPNSGIPQPAGNFPSQRINDPQDFDGGRGGSSFISREEEDRLILAAREGDLSAFNRLVLAYQDRLYRWVASLVKDEALADDVTQSAFILAYQKLDTFRGGSFRAWIFTIARNLSFDEIRRKKRHPTISLDGARNSGRDGAQEGGSKGDSENYDTISIIQNDAPLPEDAAVQLEQVEMVYRLLDRIPEPFRQVLQLVDMDGMDYLEVAELLQLPLGTVKSRLARARLKARGLFLEKGLLIGIE